MEKTVFDYIVGAIKAAKGDSEKLNALRLVLDAIAGNDSLSAELRCIRSYVAYVFRNDENVLESLDLYYNSGTEEDVIHFDWNAA